MASTASLFEELCSRTVVLRYIVKEGWWYLWEHDTIYDWTYIVTSHTLLEDIHIDIRLKYDLKGEIHLVNSEGKKITHCDQLKRYETYIVVVE